MAEKTQLSLTATPGRRYAAFVAKSEALTISTIIMELDSLMTTEVNLKSYLNSQ